MLEINEMNAHNAFTDIVVYKMVYPHKKDANKCISYVMGYEYTIGKENENIDIKTDGNRYTDVDGTFFLMVREGYHSYASKDLQLCTGTVVAKCVIPAGSKYFIDSYKKEYVSSNIIVKELLIAKNS